MKFDREWTQFAADAEVDHFGTKRLVDAHNMKVTALEADKAALRKRVERLKKLLGRAADYIERFNSDDLHDLVGLPPTRDTVNVLREEALARPDLSKLPTQQKPTEEVMEEA